MNKKQFFIGLTVWVLLLFLGSGRAFEPYRTVGVHGHSGLGISEEFVHNNFKVRLAPLATTLVGGYVSRLTSEDQEEGGFDALAWSVRETKRRFGLVLLFLMISGVAVHWIVSQILRGVKDYTSNQWLEEEKTAKPSEATQLNDRLARDVGCDRSAEPSGDAAHGFRPIHIGKIRTLDLDSSIVSRAPLSNASPCARRQRKTTGPRCSGDTSCVRT